MQIELLAYMFIEQVVLSLRDVWAGREAHVMTFEVGAVLEDAKWQAPVYCFEKRDEDDPKLKAQFLITTGSREGSLDGLLRGLIDI